MGRVCYGIPNQEALTVTSKLVDDMFCRFSPPGPGATTLGSRPPIRVRTGQRSLQFVAD